MKPKVIIAAKCHSYVNETLAAKGFDVVHKPTINYSSLIVEIQEYEGIITTTSVLIDKKMIDKAINLKFIGRLGSGMEHIDVEYALTKNIKCVSSPEGNCNAVAEHCLALLLSLMNNINKSNSQLKKGFYNRDENRGEELTNKTIGIIGYGHTGSAFAKLLQPFNVNILANDIKFLQLDNNNTKQAELNEILNECDIISLHLPLTNLTKYLANKHFFDQLKKPIYFLNTSRGEVVNTNDLVEAIKNKKLKAVGLDVLENEKLNTYTDNEKVQLDFLLNQENVIITPHIAGYSQESYFKMAKIVMDKLGF